MYNGENGLTSTLRVYFVIRVEFGDEVFQFSSSDLFTGFQVESRYITESDEPVRNIFGSNRTIGVNFNETNPPDLIFSFFSGNYYASFDKEDLVESRPVYWERGFVDSTSGMFYYCDAEKAWVFTVPALGEALAVPASTIE